jgi:hypothetical protein
LIRITKKSESPEDNALSCFHFCSFLCTTKETEPKKSRQNGASSRWLAVLSAQRTFYIPGMIEFLH